MAYIYNVPEHVYPTDIDGLPIEENALVLLTWGTRILLGHVVEVGLKTIVVKVFPKHASIERIANAVQKELRDNPDAETFCTWQYTANTSYKLQVVTHIPYFVQQAKKMGFLSNQ